jgi:hypothetical protein
VVTVSKGIKQPREECYWIAHMLTSIPAIVGASTILEQPQFYNEASTVKGPASQLSMVARGAWLLGKSTVQGPISQLNMVARGGC